jgi:hypothetical protein
MSGRIMGARVGGQQKAEDKGEQQRVSPDIGRLFNGGNQTMQQVFIAAFVVFVAAFAWLNLTAEPESAAEAEARKAEAVACRLGDLTACPPGVMAEARRVADALEDGEVTRSQLRRIAECETRWPGDASRRIICASAVLDD